MGIQTSCYYGPYYDTVPVDFDEATDVQIDGVIYKTWKRVEETMGGLWSCTYLAADSDGKVHYQWDEHETYYDEEDE